MTGGQTGTLETKLTMPDIATYNGKRFDLDIITTLRASSQRCKLFDEAISLIINDRPKYIPEFMWNWMLRKVLKIERQA
jgi:hypothetical protein